MVISVMLRLFLDEKCTSFCTYVCSYVRTKEEIKGCEINVRISIYTEHVCVLSHSHQFIFT